MAAHQAPLSLGFSRQEHWSGLPFPSPMHESEKSNRSVMSDPQRPHGRKPSRLLHPWDFPGKSTGVGCHCLLRYDSQFHAILKILNSHLKLKLFCTCSDMPQVGSLQKESSTDWPASTRIEVEVCITRERDNLAGYIRALTWTRSPRKDGQLWHLLNLWPW